MKIQIPATVALLAGAKSVGDKDGARELEEYIENNRKMYKGIISYCIENLAKKMFKGTFDKVKSEKLWKGVADEGAKQYQKEFGGREKYSDVFTAETRRMCAKELAKYYLDEIKERVKELKKEAKEKEKAKKAKMKSSSDFDDLIGELSNICEDDEYYSERKTVLYELAKLMKDNKYNDTNAYKKWKDFVDDVAKERKKLYKEDYPQKVCQEVAKDMTKEYKTYAKDEMKLYSHIHANVEKEVLIHI